MAGAVAGGSRVRLRRLSERRDGDSWVIGRIETGDFISVPDVAHRVIALLRQGRSVDEVSATATASRSRTNPCGSARPRMSRHIPTLQTSMPIPARYTVIRVRRGAAQTPLTSV